MKYLRYKLFVRSIFNILATLFTFFQEQHLKHAVEITKIAHKMNIDNVGPTQKRDRRSCRRALVIEVMFLEC